MKKELFTKPTRFSTEPFSCPESVGQNFRNPHRWAIACDDQAWSKTTDEYDGFSAGTGKDYVASDKTVFNPDTKTAGAVKQYLYVGTNLLEWDMGDAKAATEALAFIGDLAVTIGKLFWGEAGEKVGKIIAKCLEYLGKLITWLGGDPDGLGERSLAWTAKELWQMTNNPSKRSTGTLEFFDNPQTYKYQVSYSVFRMEG